VTPDEALAATVREEWGRLVALLLAQFRRLDLVEDALGDAVEAGARTWSRDGIPDRPPAWLLTAARRRVLDRLRAEAMAARTRPLLVVDAEVTAARGSVRADPGDLVDDEVLRLVLMCCHPALAPEVASALALRLVVGVTTADIARLFLVPEPTMAARVTRGKRKIVTAGIPFGVPDATALPERLGVVAQVAYLAFTAGYAPGSGPDLLRADLSGEAVRLVRVTLALRPDEPVLRALLALLLLQHSRRDARVGDDGRLVLLPDQDRSRWDATLIAEALPLVERALRLRRPPGPYALQAAIAALHAEAARAEETDWWQIAALYRELSRVAPGPVVELNRAVAIAMARGPAAGLALVDSVAGELDGYHLLHATRADLLRRLDRAPEAAAAYRRALELASNGAEREFLARRLAELERPR